jgi:plasmid replication initiation protein
MFYCIMSQMEKGYGIQKDIYENLWFQVPTRLLGNQHFEDLNKASDELHNARFKFIDKQNEAFSKITPFPVCHYQKRWGYIKIKMDADASPYLAELTKGYFYLRLKAVLGLKSMYAQRWYEFFSEKKDIGVWKNVAVDYIQNIFDINEDDYKRNNDMIKRVVYDPIKEINATTDLFIEYQTRGKRPIYGFDFIIKSGKNASEMKVYSEIDDYYNNLRNEAAEQGGKVISQKLTELQNKYGFNQEAMNVLIENKHVLNEVIKADELIENGTVTVQTTLSKYMNGVINRALGKTKNIKN